MTRGDGGGPRREVIRDAVETILGEIARADEVSANRLTGPDTVDRVMDGVGEQFGVTLTSETQRIPSLSANERMKERRADGRGGGSAGSTGFPSLKASERAAEMAANDDGHGHGGECSCRRS